MENVSRTEFFLDHLRREGYLPNTDEDGDIVFKREGRTYMIRIDSNDAIYFQMILPSIWKAEDETNRREVLEACNVATSSTKVVKMFMTTDSRVHAAVEMFSDSPEEVSKVISRCFRAIDTATAKFVQELQGG